MAKRNFNKNHYILAGVVVLVLIVLVLNSSNITGAAISKQPNFRPQYCDQGECINDSLIFQYLPPYPQDFQSVDLKMEASLYPIPENFTCLEWSPDYLTCLKLDDDKKYLTQPEFYPTWESQGVKYYIGLKPGVGIAYEGISGFGAYPGALVIKSSGFEALKAGMDVVAVTYVYTSWGVRSYQGFRLNTDFPGEVRAELGKFEAKNPPNARDFFDLKISPEEILLEPNYLFFYPNWAQKVTINIHVKESTPPGKYVIAFSPANPSDRFNAANANRYGFRYLPFGGAISAGGNIYYVFLEVSP